MNVTKMRHALERTAKSAEAVEHGHWLASLTPEHRAKHEKNHFTEGSPCWTCIAIGMQRFNEQMTQLRARQQARHAEMVASLAKGSRPT